VCVIARCRTIYDNLSKVGDADTQETFKVRVQEIDPTIRFCNYNLSQGEDLSGIRGTAAAQGASSDVLLQAKLDVRPRTPLLHLMSCLSLALEGRLIIAKHTRHTHTHTTCRKSSPTSGRSKARPCGR
jgi:hypothetical protein